ncbi:MAG: metallophosphoesterase, partial [Pseudomonadota bacterium]
MSPIVLSVVFACFVTVVGAGLHYYVWRRMVHDTVLPGVWRRGLTFIVLILAVIASPLLFLGRLVVPGVYDATAFPVFAWMGLLFLFFVLLVSVDIVKLVTRVVARLVCGHRCEVDYKRRVFLARFFAGVVAIVALGGGGVGILNAGGGAKVQRLHVTLERLPAKMEGFTIVQLCDLHLGAPLGRDWLEEIVEKTNKLEPHLIVITGDIVDGSVSFLKETVAPLRKLRAPFGVFFVTGNHEYFSGVNEWIVEFKKLGLRLLHNERVSIGKGTTSFDLAGVDDHSAARIQPDHGPDLKKALVGRDPSRELVLLAHQPKAIFEAAEMGVGLQLSGHTHGGQIWPFNYFVYLQQ